MNNSFNSIPAEIVSIIAAKHVNLYVPRVSLEFEMDGIDHAYRGGFHFVGQLLTIVVSSPFGVQKVSFGQFTEIEWTILSEAARSHHHAESKSNRTSISVDGVKTIFTVKDVQANIQLQLDTISCIPVFETIAFVSSYSSETCNLTQFIAEFKDCLANKGLKLTMN
jgi:hypothetical protein